MSQPGPSAPDWLALYLEEDVGAGDVTANALFPPTARGAASVVARERLLVAGTAHAAELFRRLGATATAAAPDGQWVERGATVLRVEGPVRAILSAERVALNLLSRMSGVASLTRELSEALAAACCTAMVAATRKTTPGFRAFEKEAVEIGGGDAHRKGLWDAAMVKDNHLAACGGDVAAAVRKVLAANPGLTVTCEVESLADALAAARAGAHWLLIDNQPPATGKAWAEAVWNEAPGVKVEASGGIRPDNILEYGWADRVSLGWLTQKAPGKDLSLEWGTA
ncbi:MAG: carboxylating nicotinate-nucleotide diphosphorylase [Halobacteriales archaeon]|nr:carboxylating nicotinate-nucleotide diphosphorylase [Halobacteriales archaeon]